MLKNQNYSLLLPGGAFVFIDGFILGDIFGLTFLLVLSFISGFTFLFVFGGTLFFILSFVFSFALFIITIIIKKKYKL